MIRQCASCALHPSRNVRTNVSTLTTTTSPNRTLRYYSHTLPKHSLSQYSIPSWATYDPKVLGKMSTPYVVQNIVNGAWQSTNSTTTNMIDIPHPYNTDIPYPIFTVPDISSTEDIQPYIQSLRSCPKTGLHNPYKNVERYVQFGDISRKVTFVMFTIKFKSSF